MTAVTYVVILLVQIVNLPLSHSLISRDPEPFLGWVWSLTTDVYQQLYVSKSNTQTLRPVAHGKPSFCS